MKKLHSIGRWLLLIVSSNCLLAQDSTTTNTTPVFSSERIAAPRQEYVWPDWTPPESSAPTNATIGLHKPVRANDDTEGHLGAFADYRRLNGDYDSLTQAALLLEVTVDRHNVTGLFVSAGAFELKPGSVADMAAHQPYFGEIGIIGKHYFTPRHTFLRPYFVGNVSFALMAWEYRRPTVSGDEIVNSDWLKGIGAYGGCGLSVRASRHLSLFGEIGGGGMALYHSGDDRSNDTVFNDFGYVGVKAGLNLVF